MSVAQVGPCVLCRVALEAGRRWVVEHQVGAKGLELSDTSPKQVVYIYGCRDSVIQV